ncbi:MAG: FHA domain-containing protein [Verrucomicrobia bacterium]|nr:FHA domain-containing protein [Verrucomicrobiota bacterium]
MIQLEVLAGNRPTAAQRVANFPFTIGRAANSGLRLEDAGVWDNHLELTLPSTEGIRARVLGDALATLNGERFTEARLRNGDALRLGSVTLRFWLAPASQRELATREFLTWLALAALTLAQLGAIFWLRH